jgi:NAD(P)-dependent dehydrogenase (short-subunit alcohol dehydrogenase family)
MTQRMQRLDGQVAVVTGGASGIGGATCRRLAEEGAKVLVTDVDIPRAEANVARIRDAGGIAEVLRADVGKHEDIRNIVQTAVDHWGRLDIMVNNAYSPAHGSGGSALDVTEEAWDAGMGLLVKSIFLATKYAVPEMQKSGGGSIVNIASVHGLLMAPQRLVYEAGKSAVIGITKQMATDFGPMGIRVNAICPGHIVTERLEEQWAGNPSGLEFFEDQYPLRKVGRPEDIGNAIVFLCSDEASFITGHSLVVDGGLTVQLQEDFGVRQAQFINQNPDTQLPY